MCLVFWRIISFVSIINGHTTVLCMGFAVLLHFISSMLHARGKTGRWQNNNSHMTDAKSHLSVHFAQQVCSSTQLGSHLLTHANTSVRLFTGQGLDLYRSITLRKTANVAIFSAKTIVNFGLLLGNRHSSNFTQMVDLSRVLF